jgi:hypothetical protein
MRRLVPFLCVALLSTGCTSLALKRTTVHQSESLTDLYQQQVLDNLAKFVQDPNALPEFALANSGTSTVADNAAQGASNLGFNGTGFNAAVVGLPSGQRTVTLGWTLTPINDPHKLALMRCAYQKAVAACGKGTAATSCPDCDGKLDDFYGLKKPSAPETDPLCSKCSSSPTAVPPQRCCVEPACCWFHCGSKKDKPWNCDCIPVGHYCGTYVWVPAEGRDELTKLVMNILDFAFRDSEASVPPTKEVTANFDSDGNLVKDPKNAAITVKAVIDLAHPVTPSNAACLLLCGQEARKARTLRAPTIEDRPRMGIFELQQQLNQIPRP